MMRKLLIVCMLLLPVAAQAGKVQEIKTPGGFTVWLVEEHSLPIIATHIGFTESGTAHDPADKDGRTNMAVALLMEGAGERTAPIFNAALEERAIRMNMAMDDDMVYATMQNLSEHRDMAFALLADALIRPRFDADAIERVRAKMQVLLVEQSASPSYKLATAWQQAAYKNHPYSRTGLGTKESLGKLTKEDFREFTRRYLTRGNMVISIVGDITPAQATSLVDTHFAGLPRDFAPDTQVPDISMPHEAFSQVVAHDIPQSLVTFGLPGMKRNDPDYLAAYVMNHMLGGSGLGSLLADEIRVKRGLAYSVRTQLEPKMHAGEWRGMFSTRNAQVHTALAALKETLTRFSAQGVSDAQLRDAKDYLTGSFVLNLSSNDAIAAFLTNMQVNTLGIDYLERRNAMVEAISQGDIARVGKRLIDASRLRVVMVGKPE